VDPRDVELVPLNRARWPMALGVAVAVLFLAAAIVKPWGEGTTPAVSSSAAVATGAGRSGAVPTAALGPLALASPGIVEPSGSPFSLKAIDPGVLCMSSDSWLVVVDDVELGQTVRTWLAADAEYSAVPPTGSTLPVEVVTSGVVHLGLCSPPEAGGSLNGTWVGTFWREAASPSQAPALNLAARLQPSPGTYGALANPVGPAATKWSPGLYLIEIDFSDSTRKAWLGLLIAGQGS
jgi:hypothetical protein